MTRRTMADRRRAAADRATRREALSVLLDRAQRGTALTPDEVALLRAHVAAETVEADELRQTVAGQQNAIQRAHDRTRAAEAAITEAEADAHRNQTTADRTRTAWRSARARARREAEAALAHRP
ncbi:MULTISPECIES: hypothetical protein [Streptomyces]|uniref:hypothetical protein n=1 Tax=Streptomyces TaxID=1883 RepID=UPI000C27275A|nr:hypothetical protein [Streptomyces sp. CB02120-2]PJN19284.1 hypothetical protein CG724_11070 [Streptomyces sp. CB02120-2]